ncbi:uncharacterized protein FOMMEDRAFT_134996 [Fomitiporia mediterranea MF3/22]|uniref:uncharacterized protein n=1 Tax=Fomitiporia mediterranea (strain MF3/22) TaxID=694068 RepID=UPI0004407E54|nr:uncharacterized protein FOMMEDRAFT_134996 [Fomitiporia mediterranea MF3/22]EJD02480.1 hypothetical protein FOMMEDRAFT_134996 [Fomitiporia mediterranea MF3/22]
MPTVATNSTLLSLPDEIIIEILINCPIKTVLRVERTCRSLHQVCQSRPVWKALLEGLDIEHAPSVNPFEPLDAVPVPDLKQTVISAIRKHRNWRDPRQVHDMFVVDLPLDRSPEGWDVIVEPRLLPSGKEILVLNCGMIELWSLETKERLWALTSPMGRSSCAGYDFEVTNGGTTLVTALLFEDFELSTTSPLRVYSYDFTNKTHTLMFERVLPPVFLFRMMIRGDYFIGCIPRTFQTVVINWKSGEALLLDFVDTMGNRIDPRSTVLADDNLIAFVTLAEDGFAAIRLPLSALNGKWSKAPDHTSWPHVSVRPSELGSTVLLLPYPGQEERVINRNDGLGPWILAHRVYKPTWKPNAPTEIFIAAYDFGPGGQTPTRLVSFRLQLSRSSSSSPTERVLSLVKSSCAQASQLPWNSRSLSNAGRMFSLRSKIRCFSLFTDATQPMNELNLNKDIVPCADEIEPVISSVEPWSGAIAIGMPGMVKVINFL